MKNPPLGRALRVPLGRAALPLCLGGAGPVAAGTLEVGPDKPFQLPSAAAAQAQDGDLIRIAPGRYVDCAVWKANNLVITGTGRAPDTVIADQSCGGKGLFLTDGTGITIRNLTLTGARVPSRNGAGIRMQANNLTVEGVRFIDNENGILVENNRFRVDGDYHSFLVVNEAVTGAVLRGNRLSGSAKALLGNGEVH